MREGSDARLGPNTGHDRRDGLDDLYDGRGGDGGILAYGDSLEDQLLSGHHGDFVDTRAYAGAAPHGHQAIGHQHSDARLTDTDGSDRDYTSYWHDPSLEASAEDGAAPGEPSADSRRAALGARPGFYGTPPTGATSSLRANVI